MAQTFKITWDTTQKEWRLPIIDVSPDENFEISYPAHDDRKETIIYMHPGITEEDVYYIDEFHKWKCKIKVKKLPENKIPVTKDFGNGIIRNAVVDRSLRKTMSLTKADDITYTFTAIVDYNDLSKAKYIYSNSVCRIRITY